MAGNSSMFHLRYLVVDGIVCHYQEEINIQLNANEAEQ